MIKINIREAWKHKISALDNLRLLLLLAVAPSILFVLFFGCNIAKADDFFALKQVPLPLAGDFNFSSDDGLFSISMASSSVSTTSTAASFYLKATNIARKDDIGQFFTVPSGLSPSTDLYSVKIESNGQLNFTQPPAITLKYQDWDDYSDVYYYNWSDLQFEKIETVKSSSTHTFTFSMPAGKSSIIFAVLSKPSQLGTASWYVHPKYKKDLIAASVDFPQNTQLRVINLSNNKEVIVTVKDYGPDKSVFPDRVIDLSKEAFKAISPIGAGVIRVKVIPI